MNPHSRAFVFEGGTGTGKTTAAMLMAEGLGVRPDQRELGGFSQVASGEQTGEVVRRMLDGLRQIPFTGSGWRVVVINEADAMTAGAAFVWLDGLENLPPKTVVIFTTNEAGKMPDRLLDRCERLCFESSALLLRPAAQRLANRIWRRELGRRAPAVERFGVLVDERGEFSFRRLLQAMEPCLRTGEVPARGKAMPRPRRIQVAGSAAANKAWATRKAAFNG